MPDTSPELLLGAMLLVVLVALYFDFCNGWNDSANAIATVVSTRVLRPWQAVAMNAVLNFVGALVSTKVARTIAGKFVDENLMSLGGVFAAMAAASAWVTWCTHRGLPISGSHSLMGGIIGAALGTGLAHSHAGSILKWEGITPALVALLLSPVLGLVLGYLLLVATLHGAAAVKLSAARGKRVFGALQLFSSALMAYQHGKNDAQKVMGVITLALVTLPPASAALLPAWVLPRMEEGGPEIPLWVVLACACVMAWGTASGGWKVIRTLGGKLADLRPVEGFAAETAGGAILEVAGEMGVPVSTTHTITGSILGVGSARRPKAVKWGTGGKIFLAWVYTFPVTIGLGFALAFGLAVLTRS